MRKNALTICGSTCVLGAFGVFLRWVQNQVCFDPETGLAVSGKVWPYLTVLWIVVAAAVLGAQCQRMKNRERTHRPETFAEAFVAERPAAAIAAVCCGVLMAAGSAVLFATVPSSERQQILLRLLAGFGVLTGIAFPVQLRSTGEEPPPAGTAVAATVPIVLFAFETFLPNPGDYSFLYTGNASHLTTKWWITRDSNDSALYGQMGILYNKTIWNAYAGTLKVSAACSLLAGTIGTLIGYAVSRHRRSKWASYVNSIAFLPYLMPSIAVSAAFFVLFSSQRINLFNTYTLLILAGTVKYIPFASRNALNSMLQLSGEIEEAAQIQNVPWIRRMTHIIIPIQKTSILSGYMLPFMTCLRELSLFLLLCTQGFILSTTLDYFDEMGLYAFSSAINLILIVTILVFNFLVNKLTGAGLDSGIGKEGD